MIAKNVMRCIILLVFEQIIFFKVDAIYREIVASLYNLVRSNLSQSQLVRTMAGNSRLQGIRECFESFAHSMKAADCSVTLSTLLLGGTSSHGLDDNDYAFLDSRNGLEVDRSVASTLNGNDARCSSVLERQASTAYLKPSKRRKELDKPK